MDAGCFIGSHHICFARNYNVPIFALFSRKSQMDHACKLSSKCLQEEESLEKCNIAECQNVIHPSCCKKLMAMFGENECEGPFK